MKSAYDLAMEKFGDDPVTKLTDEQKKALSEIEKKYQAKNAEADLAAQDRRKKALGNRDLLDQINNDLIVERASLRERCERDKDRIRNEK